MRPGIRRRPIQRSSRLGSALSTVGLNCIPIPFEAFMYTLRRPPTFNSPSADRRMDSTLVGPKSQ